MVRMSGGEAAARTLQASGVEFVFGMTVGGQAPFTLAVIQLGMRLMTVRDEKCASLMATGYSRISGKPGVCIASNPGAAHLALGMYEAHQSADAIVAITSDPNPAGDSRRAGFGTPRRGRRIDRPGGQRFGDDTTLAVLLTAKRFLD